MSDQRAMGALAAQDVYDDTQLVPYGVGSPAESAGAPSGMGALASGAYEYLGGLAKRAFGASEQMRTEGTYNPAPIMEAAMLPMTGAVAGTGPGGFAVGSGPIRAYHSSPHDFDKFDLSKIGTGEGAQMYGHGLYFAESPAVSGQGGQYWNQFLNRFEGHEGNAARALQRAGFDREAALKANQRDIDQLLTNYGDKLGVDPRYDTALERMRKEHALLTDKQPVGPRTYEVNINADPAHMLDWDKPLKEQAIKDAIVAAANRLTPQGPLAKALNQDLRSGNLGLTGEGAYSAIGGIGRGEGKVAASEALREAGIPGIKYLDAGSRNATPIVKADKHGNIISSEYPPPSSNYVVFDPSIIDIMKKYGIAGAAPAGMGALAAQDAYRGEQ